MKKFFKMFGAVGLLAGMLMMAGCGDDDVTPLGTVVKGPVNGATVSFAGTTGTVKTDVNGRYVIAVPGVAVTSTGGTYYNFATGTTATAPTLSAEAGAIAITPITTVLSQLTGTANATARANFLTALAKLGVTNPLADSLGAVNATGSNKVAIALNEILGAAIASGATTANLGTFVAAIATSVNASAPTTEAALATVATTAAGTGATAVVPATAVATFNTIATAVNALKPGAPLPTGSTGSSSTTGK